VISLCSRRAWTPLPTSMIGSVNCHIGTRCTGKS
jgi:hypothetical protein